MQNNIKIEEQTQIQLTEGATEKTDSGFDGANKLNSNAVC